jgi:pimeloyl-ACP methyl ester carboxylesterase
MSSQTFVLIHGLGAGRWCWEPVIPALEAAGHRVVAPSLSGQEDGATTLSDHVAEAVAIFTDQDLTDVVLVGHSYGGMVITGVAEAIPERVARLIYLDATYPRDGEASFDCLPVLAGALVPLAVDNLVPAPSPEMVGVVRPADIEIARREQLSLPILCAQEKGRRTERQAHIPRAFVFATQSVMGDMAARAREEGIDYYEIDTPHMLMMNEPEETVRLLLAIAAGQPATAVGAG